MDPGVLWAVAVIAALVLIVLLAIWRKGRPFASGDVFRASRLSAGNRLFPTQVLISPTSVVHYTPEWFGRLEHSMHMAHVASVRIDTNLMFSDVYIETTGGASPIRCHGHKKADAVRMKALIERYQTEYYRASGR
ncbi:MAG TPA: hypothetical protein VJM31_04990 [Vicinamibacterales bacterium]|nr:hypothetical protein [Vicinamibacterales bacterium]